MERAGLTRLTVTLLVLVVVAAGWWTWRRSVRSGATAVIPGDMDHTLVEVLNGTTSDGLARAVTGKLRRAGIDVVSFGSAGDTALDSTTIVVRRGDSTAALRVRRALGLGRIVVQRDPRLLLDASVLVGRDLAEGLGFHP